MISPLAQAQENPCSFAGYLWGTGAMTGFEVYVDRGELILTFAWPEGACDFWVKGTGEVKIIGEDGEEINEILIEQSLTYGNRLTLSGPGIYYIELYSEWGSGCWEATVEIPESTEGPDEGENR